MALTVTAEQATNSEAMVAEIRTIMTEGASDGVSEVVPSLMTAEQFDGAGEGAGKMKAMMGAIALAGFRFYPSATGGATIIAPVVPSVPVSSTSLTALLLQSEPNSDFIYTPTYVSSKLTTETWKRIDNTLIKSIDYTYAGSVIATEVRKVFKPDGTTIDAQLNLTFNYTLGVLTSASAIGTSLEADLSNDLLLQSEPNISFTYTPTYVASKLSAETWKRGDDTLIKSIDYTYSGSHLITEVRKVFSSNGTLVAQLTLSFTYTLDLLTSVSSVRNL